MLNLILKDVMLLKKAVLWIVGLWIYFMISVKGIGVHYLAISFLMASQPMSQDERNKTESLLVSLPVKRSSIVIARYVYTLLVIAVVVAVTYFASRLLNIFFPADFAKVITLKGLLAGQLAVMFFLSLAYPLFFRYGSHLETGIKVIVISLMVILGSVIILSIILTNLGLNIFNIKLVYNFLAMCVFMAASFGVSLVIYKRREF